jgi:hypothetical protein
LKILRVVFAGLLGLTVAALAQAATQVTVRFDIGAAPPPHVMFHSEPHVVYVPQQQTYVVDDPVAGDYDCFRYGGYWYAFRGGYWYRADRWNGAFVVVHPARVPVAIYNLPPGRWKHRAMWTDEHREARAQEIREDRRDDHHDNGKHGKHGKHGNHDDQGDGDDHADRDDHGDHGHGHGHDRD